MSLHPSDTLSFPVRHIASRGKAKRIAQIHAMQDTLFGVVQSLEVEPRQRAQCACAWEKLESMRRKLMGIPDPGALRPEPAPSKRKGTVSLLNTAPDPKGQ